VHGKDLYEQDIGILKEFFSASESFGDTRRFLGKINQNLDKIFSTLIKKLSELVNS